MYLHSYIHYTNHGRPAYWKHSKWIIKRRRQERCINHPRIELQPLKRHVRFSNSPPPFHYIKYGCFYRYIISFLCARRRRLVLLYTRRIIFSSKVYILVYIRTCMFRANLKMYLYIIYIIMIYCGSVLKVYIILSIYVC